MPGRQRHPRPACKQVLAVLDDGAPAGVGRLHADRQEGQRAFSDDVEGHHDRNEDDEGGCDIGQNVAQQDAVARHAEANGSEHELAFAQRQHLSADRACNIGHIDHANDEDGEPQRAGLDRDDAEVQTLFIAGMATVVTLFFATLIGLAAGFFGGITDMLLSRFLDVLWAFPVYLLAISLSIVLIAQGLEPRPHHDQVRLACGCPSSSSASSTCPTWRARSAARSCRCARASSCSRRSASACRASASCCATSCPTSSTTLIVFVPIMMALNMLTESALSFLSIGVQPPDASWGTIIQDGQDLLYTRPMVALAPGIAIVLTVLALNVLGDGLRDALDPRSKIRIGRS